MPLPDFWFWKYARFVQFSIYVKVWILDIALLTWEDSWTAALYNLGSGRLAADWHGLVVPRRDMQVQPSVTRNSGQADPRCRTTNIPPPQSDALGPDPVGIARWVGVGTQQPPAGFEPTTSRSQVRHRIPLDHRVPCLLYDHTTCATFDLDRRCIVLMSN